MGDGGGLLGRGRDGCTAQAQQQAVEHFGFQFAVGRARSPGDLLALRRGVDLLHAAVGDGDLGQVPDALETGAEAVTLAGRIQAVQHRADGATDEILRQLGAVFGIERPFAAKGAAIGVEQHAHSFPLLFVEFCHEGLFSGSQMGFKEVWRRNEIRRGMNHYFYTARSGKALHTSHQQVIVEVGEVNDGNVFWNCCIQQLHTIRCRIFRRFNVVDCPPPRLDFSSVGFHRCAVKHDFLLMH